MPQSSRFDDVKIGAFVLSALIILVTGSLWIAGTAILGGRRVPYRVLMQDSGGVQEGDRVRVAGVSVGKIRRVVLQPEGEWPVVFQVSVRPDLSIRSDASARIASSGVLGTYFLQIAPGSADAPPLPPGGEILGQAGSGLDGALAQVDELSNQAIRLVAQVSEVLDQVSGELIPILGRAEGLLSERNTEEIGRILSNLDRTIEDASPRVSSLLARLESISAHAAGGTERLPGLTARLESLVDGLHASIGPDGARLGRVLDLAEEGLGAAEGALSVVGHNREELGEAVRDLRDTAANLKAFSRTIKDRPFSLVRIRPEPERTPGQGVE